MIYFISSIYGFLFVTLLLVFNSKSFILKKSQWIYRNNEKLFLISKETTIFPYLMIVLFSFIYISAFQYIETTDIGRWGRNDLPRYYFPFSIVKKTTFKEFFVNNMQEPLYLFVVWIIGNITKHFSFFLAIIYIFHFFALKEFLKEFNVPITFFSIIAIYAMCFTTIIISFCLLRMGIAISISYYFYIFLKRKKFKISLLLLLVAIGFHFSAVFLFFPFVIYRVYSTRSIKKIISFFLVTFILESIVAFIIPYVLPRIFGRYAHYLITNNNSIAMNTYISTFAILVFILLIRKCFETEKNILLFIIILSVLYILPLQRVLSIFYRLIFFSYSGIALGLIALNQLYRKKKSILMYVLFSTFSFLYFMFFLNSFYKNAISMYGLNNYSLPYFY